MGQAIPGGWWLAGLELAAWLATWAVFSRPAIFHALLLPAFLMLPADIWLNLTYGRGFSVRHLAILSESSSQESLEFLGAKIWSALAAFFVCLAWWAMSFRAARRLRALEWRGRSRRMAQAVIAVIACVIFYGWIFGVAPACVPDCDSSSAAGDDQPDNDAATAPSYALPAWTLSPFENISPADVRPFGWMATAIDFWRERRDLKALADKNRGFSFGAHVAHAGQKPLVVVLVIGESGRYDRWGLNGYARDTTPLLRKEKNAISFSNVVSPVSATRLSLPIILTRKGTLNAFRTGFREKSLISAFREAGFRTFWLSNQIAFGDYDTPVSVFAREADVVEFLNPGGYAGKSSYDGALLKPFAQALQEGGADKLIILHTLGNHWNYGLRYPAEFDRWTPSLSAMPEADMDDETLRAGIGNSYDNSVLYTDWFLTHVISALRAAAMPALVLYVSDHGENLHDGKCTYSTHGHNTVYDFHVPMLAWYSPSYAEEFPAKASMIKSRRDAKLSTENIFPSLLDMAGISYAGETPDRSWANVSFRPRPRYVDSYGWADYDRSELKGVCHEVIDPVIPAARRTDPL